MDWWNLIKQSVTVGAQLLWSGRYGCNNGRYGCTIVMSYIEINKAVSQWLLTFNLCVSVTWPLTCAFHIPCTHTPEIIDMHRGMCDKTRKWHVYVNRLTHQHTGTVCNHTHNPKWRSYNQTFNPKPRVLFTEIKLIATTRCVIIALEHFMNAFVVPFTCTSASTKCRMCGMKSMN